MGIGPVKWDEVEEYVSRARKNGDITIGGLRHGHTFLQLCDIRGYENVIFDLVDNEPNLMKLITMIEEFNLEIINRYIEMRVDIMSYPEDLGMQTGPMLSPEHFRRFIKPSYQRLIAPSQEKGAIIHMHSEGYIHDLIDDIIDCSVEVINLQDLVNGIDWIADRLAGKVCVELDIDRQFITSEGTPEQIDTLICEEVRKIGRKEGGLMMIYGLYPGIPLENIKALMDAMERYAFYY
jgi:uroporphyrinogen-III decarboxylase